MAFGINGKTTALAAVCMLAATLSGCGGDKAAEQPAQAMKDEIGTAPIDISIFFTTGKPTNEAFEEIFVLPVKKKYPNITLRMAEGKLDELITANQVPDLVYSHIGYMYALDKLDLPVDLNPYVQKYKVDMNRFDPVAIQAIEKAKAGQLAAFPYILNFGGLYYNKDIFDKFGSAYPRDGMTWDDTIELAKKMSRLDGGVQYKGLIVYSLARFQRVAGNTFYDPKTNKATLESPEWKSFFDIFMRIYTIPGNELPNPNDTLGYNPFLKERNVAMLAQNNIIPNYLFEASQNGFNWDVAQYPSLPSRPNIMTDADVQTISITKTSKHKDAAMQVLLSVTSDEVQMNLAKKYARLSSLKDPKFKAAVGEDSPYLKGKNIAGIFKSGIGQSPFRDEIAGQGSTLIDKAFADAYSGQKDVNTALREANEALNKFIQEQARQ
ncbi:extracellular solute-binding protein [Paenibacillus hemerocallicola]|uniref:Extracellular solute-binding protein n=1 Tax=Paenibacillus hemerocallicola TaxID=1172614 RepID=A0A5C4T552_9BACL|nr:extracellular solute-binding protein [Paenibacillus hemerocallicola]TNJ63319.1 extracellular solute-binding protein [Paenibacillus hemerocallicola]